MCYNDLDAKVSQNKWVKSDADEGWEYNVKLDAEKVLDPSINSKQRIATVKVRKEGDSNERFELKVPIIQKGSGLPVGTILAYVGDLDKIPSGWFLCDGTNGTPDLRTRFLEGVTAVGDVQKFKRAGLPNLQGHIMTWKFIQSDGRLFWRNEYIGHIAQTKDGGNDPAWRSHFDASHYNPIYGRSNTVQPESYTVYYIIRMK